MLFVPVLPAWSATTYAHRTDEFGLQYFGFTQGRLCLEGINGDGFTDAVISGHNTSPTRLMHGQSNGSFTPAPNNPFSFRPGDRDVHSCDAADVASQSGGPDGLPDIFVTKGGDNGTDLQEPDLWVQTSSGTFLDLTSQRGLAAAASRGRDGVFAHINGDGFLDLVTAALGSPSNNSFNKLFINQGNGHFTEKALPTLNGSRLTDAEAMAVIPDPNRFSSIVYTRKPGVVYVRNNRGTLSIVPNTPFANMGARKLGAADMNGDGRSDLIILTGNELSIWFNNGAAVGNNFPQKNFSVAVTEGWAFAACKIGNDNDVDLFVAQGTNASTSVTTLNRQDFALFNRGSGTAFVRLNVGPATEEGNADWVACAENFRGSRHALVYVTNGRWLKDGPNRVFQFTLAPAGATGPTIAIEQ